LTCLCLRNALRFASHVSTRCSKLHQVAPSAQKRAPTGHWVFVRVRNARDFSFPQHTIGPRRITR
jgi:hypothetical protein